MAAPTYANDLSDIDTAEATTNWAESTDTTWDDGGSPTQDGDSHLQNTYCVSAETKGLKTGKATLIYNNTTGITVPSNGAILVWQSYLSPNAIATYANDGQMVVVGSGLGAFKYWRTGGNDRAPNPKGGWTNVAVDPAQTATGTVGTPTATLQYIGGAITGLRSISKGNPFCIDVMRYGRCESRFTDGDVTNGYCTFAGFAALNDSSNNHWGLLGAVGGSYTWKGLMTIGYSTKAEFVDSDVNVTIEDHDHISSSFNAIEVRQATTVLNWTRVNFTSLNTVSPGSFEMIDAADVDFDTCSFADMSTFIFGTTADIISSTFLRCGTITAAGATMTGSNILLSAAAADAGALGWNVNTDPQNYLDDMTFSKGALAHHAIAFGSTAPLTMTLSGCTFTDFNASDAQNDSTFHFADRGSDVTWTLNLSGCTGNFTYKKVRAGDTVNIVADPVTIQITIKDSLTKAAVTKAAVTVRTAGSGPYPYNLSVTTLVQSAGTATATTASAHGLVTGNKVEIQGASPTAYNRIKTITVTGTTTFTYPIDSGTSSPATGTITCSAVFIDDETSATGILDDTRAFSANQAIEGFVSKGTSSPLYVRQELSDTVDKDNGLSLTVLLQSDE